MATNTFARYLRKDQTQAEQALWRELRDRRLDGLKFRRQVPIYHYIADFLCVEARLTIELDGPVHDTTFDADMKRRQVIEESGYLEIRFSNTDIEERLHWVISEIRGVIAIAKNRPIPEPLFQMERSKF